MEKPLKLPSHVKPCAGSQPTWSYNEKTKKYIHADRISAWCAAYWSHRKGVSGRDRVNQSKNLKMAQRRCED